MENSLVDMTARAPLSSTERSRLHRARNRPLETDQDSPTALPVIAAPPIAPEAVAPPSKPASAFSNAVALVAAVALAGVAAFFSVAGMIEVFSGAPIAVMVLAASMEAARLVIAGWLARRWTVVGWPLRSVLVALLVGLAVINAVGVFGKLVEPHVGDAATANASVSERMEVVDACLTVALAAVADLDHRISQIDAAVEESTRRGRMAGAMNLAAQQRSTRDALAMQRQTAAATLVGFQMQRATLVAERSRIAASAGPIQYLAILTGTDPEAAVRWLILLMVLCCDPAAIALTVAVAGVRRSNASPTQTEKNHEQ